MKISANTVKAFLRVVVIKMGKSENPRDVDQHDLDQEDVVKALLDRLSEAESMLGSQALEYAQPFVGFAGILEEGRRRWLIQTRELLKRCGRQPENLRGPWHT